jgi:uncharacterized protein (DUF924 family)
MTASLEDLLEFWFGSPPTDEDGVSGHMSRWFSAKSEFDAELSRRFGAAMSAAAVGQLDEWGESAHGRLALILLLDQCPRNTRRGNPAAFAQDPLALSWTVDGLSRGMDLELEPLERMFFYMPMQHSESLDIQERSVEVFVQLARSDVPNFMSTCLLDTAEFARVHREIVARFGRFPHRNSVLGRASTADEQDYLDERAPSFGQ